MIRINQLKLNPDYNESDLALAIKKKLKLNNQVFSYEIVKKSLDARKGHDIKYVFSVNVKFENSNINLASKNKSENYKSELENYKSESENYKSELDNIKLEKEILKKVNDKNIMLTEAKSYSLPTQGNEVLNYPPVIVGAGPAGLFCALMLAKNGYKPILIERGEDVDSRTRTVDDFWKGGKLNTESNVQFGEGGAGTFSDGKLNTQIKDSFNRVKKVLEIFHEFGADKEITFLNKPHIGTDVLKVIVKNIRNEIIKLGGQVCFNQKLTDIKLDCEAQKLTSIENDCFDQKIKDYENDCFDQKLTNIENHSNLIELEITDTKSNETKTVKTNACVLAIGHSARDTFKMLLSKNLEIKPKPFAVGVRVEHPQGMINTNQYGVNANTLPPADYKLTYRTKDNRNVFSFCMCPGGYVVNASSLENKLCVNGMSYSKRDGNNANSAIIVSVNPEDFDENDPLCCMKFQERLEEQAYKEGQGKIPVQLFGDYKNNIKSTKLGSVIPQIKGQYEFGNINNIFPEFINASLKEGIEKFGNDINGYNNDDTLIEGVESRTSSPIRIVRDEGFESSIKGVYPCGEGAGYAGGITSAAVDGIKVFEMIYSKYKGI